MTAIGVLVIVILLIALASRSNTPRLDEPEQPTPPNHFESQRWEKNHFINKHLHRDDEKHARHKRNQTPW